MDPHFIFESKLWKYSAKDPWHFITIPPKFAAEIKSLTSDFPGKGFGTVKVTASILNTSWDTSLFPDKQSGSYLLPVKKEVRSKLQLDVDDTVEVSLSILNL